MKTHQRIRYAVVGLGHIAQTAILPAFENAANSELVALVTNDPEKSAELSTHYGVPAYRYEDFERALKETRAEVAFIALPNSLHREYTERAAKVGVHVLCEKPLAPTESDCRAMIGACQQAGVKLMTAYRLHFTDAHVCAIDLARSGELGELRYFNSLFAMQVKDGNIRVKRETGGGPLFDLGVYCINAARYLFQDEPTEVFAAIARADGDERFKEVEEMASVIFKFPGARLATFTCSFGSASMDQIDLVGTECSLHIEPAYGYAGELKWRLRRGDKVEERTFPAGDQFAGEIVYFSECLRTGEQPEPSGLEGIADIRIANAIYQSAQQGRAIPLESIRRSRRPDGEQELKFPPIEEPEEVHAAAPHP